MKRRLFMGAILGVSLISPLTAHAHGPTPQKVDESVTVSAPPDKVWAIVKDFGGVGKWDSQFTAVTFKNDKDQGQERTLTLKSGKKIVEGLDFIDENAKQIGWRRVDDDVTALPVSSYNVKLTVTPDGSGSKITWDGRFYRGDTGNEPPDNLNDAAAVSAMTTMIKTGLGNLKDYIGKNVK
ncbi:SRPBCC family protein [Granulibacter bethesdensis]|uniref:Secreted protein n=1 Tax=Granulibacter bethesdensis (strain ATCC BAA-1260 / CGDNIH1) TaxID=391165 RepID=Q0BVB1_GRABC|nr:SRPBCC family protein [Granulibacter bethesdensis]ABI61241.1 Hypothetical protein GbCGDNIH1_0343 [Granulibacter bethesdensis CGDNIH1]AHJ67350.1 Hypothetical protein GbCGDNIH2_0343 [Granulibacter bethesdensis]APH51027.1 Hypothetical protein GbCGDNIH5_0343 [Granulibacter bethesdensis]APH63721.1 Hypothetical protein GbCGDNIH1I4_0343 [Granulibacter bethesdensis]